ncbi:unnamed protein product [Darwinula stevensoni]|uniref:Actin-interacting protein 1 n=1 Tax=Darwinula stevensoni TaxID=69355 RepID=A0A7R8XKE2_9CRUS|nr:unnamed protein product [Darwinula stevensoni]CAG0893048.1 unnamed protein product [Darwinula stevensoni]
MAFSKKFIFATLPRTQRGNPIVLGGDPRGENFLYTNSNSVIIRNIAHPELSDIYTEHSAATVVAKYSPSRFYIASGDVTGKVRIWDTVNKEHILKAEYQPFAGTIKDIAWSPDSQRLVAVGEGRERYGHVFMADTGTSVGEISGHGRPINSCDFKPSRPFRIATGSEDNCIGIFEGPPFKFKMTKQDHTRYVQAVRYSPNGEQLASGGFDGKVFLYDGKTSDLITEIGSPAHKGGVYGVAWGPDGQRLLTSSGDKTARLWDVSTGTCISEFPMGNAVDDQQVSCLWQGQFLLSVSLSGFINYLDTNNPEKPIRIIKGHNKPMTAMTLSSDRSTIYTGSHDGFVTHWDVASGENDRVAGQGHGNQINGMIALGETVYSCGIDDALRAISHTSRAYSGVEVRLGSQPHGLSVGEDGTIIVACVNQVVVVKDGTKVSSLPVNYEPSSCSINSQNGDVAVHVYSLAGNSLSLKQELEHHGAVTDVMYSSDGQYLAACDAHRKIVVYALPGYELAHRQEWGFHTAKVNTIAWSPNSRRLASGSLDTFIMIWNMDNPSRHIEIKNAHPMSQITKLTWIDNTTLISVGQDSNTKIWSIPL